MGLTAKVTVSLASELTPTLPLPGTTPMVLREARWLPKVYGKDVTNGDQA